MWGLLSHGGVTGNTREYDREVPGSNPGRDSTNNKNFVKN